MDYMNQQFMPVEEKLALLKKYDQIEFDLLPYYFEPGDQLVEFDPSPCRPSAFVLTSRAVQQYVIQVGVVCLDLITFQSRHSPPDDFARLWIQI
jgi:hypothetical protein